MTTRKMKVRLYSVGTRDDGDHHYSPQAGLTVPSINVPLATVRQILRELRWMGYEGHRRRDHNGEHTDNDPSILVERTNGRSEAEILQSWRHGAATVPPNGSVDWDGEEQEAKAEVKTA